MLDCLPYTFVPKQSNFGFDPDSIEHFSINFQHKNNSQTTYLGQKHFQIEVQNAFLSSQYVELYAVSSLRRLNISKGNDDQRYYSMQMIQFKLWEEDNIKIVMIFFKITVFVSVGLVVIVYAFLSMKKQENENEKMIAAQKKMKMTNKIISRAAILIHKIGYEALQKEQLLVQSQQQSQQRRELKKIDFEEDSNSDDDQNLNCNYIYKNLL